MSALALGTLAAALSGGFGFGGVHGAPYALALTPYVLLLAASQLPRATAHNWIYNPSSRASQASTARPCRAKRTATPDVHVNSGQVCHATPSLGRFQQLFHDIAHDMDQLSCTKCGIRLPQFTR